MYEKPQKKLGQNFLVDKNIQEKIIESCDLKNTDVVLEIGAGNAELTRHLEKKVKKVIALEIDKKLYFSLKENFEAFSNIQIINIDILKYKIKQKVIVVGNLPYYISTPIIEHLIKQRKFVKEIFITIQKELAERIVASPNTKEYSSFSCFVQFYNECKILFHIKRNCFYPVPKVDSSFLRLTPRLYPKKVKDKDLLFKIIRTSFQKRRKVLKNTLKELIPQETIQNALAKLNLSPTIRPENLSLDDFIELSNLIYHNT
ncbi:MAG: 16S rRNA (adenine(1518)-N(6)/adenine(1519)-N(6))-dimethyltransferase RsmA [Candidatus Omnitrophota bacterium]